MPDDSYVPEIWDIYREIIGQHERAGARELAIYKFDFYKRAQDAHAVVTTSESVLYTNIILKKRRHLMIRKSYLKQMAEDWHAGQKYGIMSACTASPLCIEATMRSAMESNTPALIEATSNQVNQFGGYTAMRPADYYSLVESIAHKVGIDMNDVILGGDHLGPGPFKTEPTESAMKKACDMVFEYVAAGFSKIHLDTSMMLGDDDAEVGLPNEKIAERAACMAKSALDGFYERQRICPDTTMPTFIIGSEVPVPGGAQNDGGIIITTPESLDATLKTFKKVFLASGCEEVWNNVIGVVVQPGVEFGDSELSLYDREVASKLTKELHNYPGMIFEGHSTDYQTPNCLKNMAEDGICILKVGPALTFYQREAIFALESIEKELFTGKGIALSDYRSILDNSMLEYPDKWQAYYSGTPEEQRFKRKYSYSDRCRYYFPNKDVSKALDRLLNNLSNINIPIALLSQYMPIQAYKVRCGIIDNRPLELILARITDLISEYSW